MNRNVGLDLPVCPSMPVAPKLGLTVKPHENRPAVRWQQSPAVRSPQSRRPAEGLFRIGSAPVETAQGDAAYVFEVHAEGSEIARGSGNADVARPTYRLGLAVSLRLSQLSWLRTAFAALTRFSRVALVSGYALVFSPQSGLTHTREAGMAATAASMSSVSSSVEGTRGE